jgi:putative ABC transport system permease protein
MLASIFSLNVIQTALELGCIYALVALALFLSYSILNIADLSTDGCFTLGCAVACQVALTGHPFLALLAAMAAGVCSGFITAFLQTRLGVESIMAGIIVNTGLYTINLAVMGFSSTLSLVKTDTVFSLAKTALAFTGGWYKLVLAVVVWPVPGWWAFWAPGWACPSGRPATTPPWCGRPASIRPLPLRWACASPVR